MKYPVGSCRRCGERPFSRADGGYHCHNCLTRYVDPEATTSGTELRYDEDDEDDVEPRYKRHRPAE